MAFGGRRMAFGGQRSAVVGGRRSALNNQNNIKNAFVKVDTLLYKVLVFICYQFIYYTLFVRNVNSILESLTKSSWLRKLKTHTRGTDGAKSLFVTKNLRLTYTPTCTPPFPPLTFSHAPHKPRYKQGEDGCYHHCIVFFAQRCSPNAIYQHLHYRLPKVEGTSTYESPSRYV